MVLTSAAFFDATHHGHKMTILDSLRQFLGGRRTAPSELAAAPNGPKMRGWQDPPKRGDQETLALSQRSIAMLKPVSKVRDGIMAVDFYATIDGGPVDEDSPLLDFLKRPNSAMSGAACRALEVLYLDILGESFAIIRQGDDGRIEYMPVPPTWVTVTPGISPTYKIRLGDLDFTFGDEDVIHMRRHSLLDPYGRGSGLGQASLDEAETEEYAARFSKAFFYNSARPEHIINLKGAGPDDIKNARASFEESNRGFTRAWRSHLVGGQGIEVFHLTSEFDKLNMVEFRRSLQDFVRELYGIPPEIFGQLENSNRATITAALEIMAKYVIDPRCKMLCDEYNAKLMPRLASMGFDVEGQEIAFVSSAPRDRDFTLEVMSKRPEAFTLNEWREIAGFGYRRNADTYLREEGKWVEVEASDIISAEEVKAMSTPPPLPKRSKDYLPGFSSDDVLIVLEGGGEKRAPAPLLLPDMMTLTLPQADCGTVLKAEQQRLGLEVIATAPQDEKVLASHIVASINAELRKAHEQGASNEDIIATAKGFYHDPTVWTWWAIWWRYLGLNDALLASYHANGIKHKRFIYGEGSHAALKQAHGTIANINEAFIIGGRKGNIPGRFNAAEYNLGCRCVIDAYTETHAKMPIKDLAAADQARLAQIDAALRGQITDTARRIEDSVKHHIDSRIIPSLQAKEAA